MAEILIASRLLTESREDRLLVRVDGKRGAWLVLGMVAVAGCQAHMSASVSTVPIPEPCFLYRKISF